MGEPSDGLQAYNYFEAVLPGPPPPPPRGGAPRPGAAAAAERAAVDLPVALADGLQEQLREHEEPDEGPDEDNVYDGKPGNLEHWPEQEAGSAGANIPSGGELIFFTETCVIDDASRLYLTFNRVFAQDDCRHTLAQAEGDIEVAHGMLRARLAVVLALSSPHSNAEQHAERSRHYQQERAAERQGRLLERELLYAERCGDEEAAERCWRQWQDLASDRPTGTLHPSANILQLANKQSLSFETVDLHGQHVKEALHIVTQVVQHNSGEGWPPYRHGTHLVVFVVGRDRKSVV